MAWCRFEKRSLANRFSAPLLTKCLSKATPSIRSPLNNHLANTGGFFHFRMYSTAAYTPMHLIYRCIRLHSTFALPSHITATQLVTALCPQMLLKTGNTGHRMHMWPQYAACKPKTGERKTMRSSVEHLAPLKKESNDCVEIMHKRRTWKQDNFSCLC